MKRWIHFAAALYPHAWRERYGREFEALLEDSNSGWREFLDVLWGAFEMQLTKGAYLKMAAATALAGGILSTALSFHLPRLWESSAVLEMKGDRKSTRL